MSKKRRNNGHYCKICGCWKANERFSGSGHAAHICKDCAKLPIAQRNEMQVVGRLMGLPFRLNKDQRKWLEAMRKDKREEVRNTAEWVYEQRYGWIEQMRKEEEELEAYLEEMGDEWEDEDWEDEEDGLDLDEIDITALPFE